jgi:hypothetical protein
LINGEDVGILQRKSVPNRAFSRRNRMPVVITNLKMGEASAMQNFRITDDYGLQVRPGTANVAGLVSDYTVATDGTVTAIATDLNAASSVFTVYPSVSVSDTGLLTLSGTPATMTYANHGTYTNYYYDDGVGNIWKFNDCIFTEATGGTDVTGGSVSVGATTTRMDVGDVPFYSAIKVVNSAVDVDGSSLHFTWGGPPAGVAGQYFKLGDNVYLIESREQVIGTYGGSFTLRLYVYLVSFVDNDEYAWNFYPVTATATSDNPAVRGIWSGYIGGTEYIVAAANGHLWSLSITDGVWSKTDIGVLDTTNGVSFFAFDDKLYMLNGEEYKSWDGTTFQEVVGYRPLVRTEVPYNGGGTEYEQVNKLNGLRRVWLSPDGSHATFQLPETGLSSVDYVKVLATGANMTPTTDYTVDTSAGTVMFTTPPTAGTDTLEVGYTASTNARATVEAMRYAEIFNGTTDNRVFIYGDGSNQAFYSDLDYNGLARADYFPDLNVISFGDSGTPLTGLIRTYNRMMAFKDNGAFNVSYGPITLTDGDVIAGFYQTPVNKDLGNKALGQACLVDNKPRTLDAGGIYEWSISNIAGDQLNAQRISQRVGTTLLTFDLPSTVTYYDKIHHEYYVLYNGKAIVQNTENDTWYIYDGIDATCMIVYQDEVYFGLTNGYIVHFSRDYMSDNGANIECYWESGSMDFDRPYEKKYSAGLWLGIKPEENGEINVTAITNNASALDEETAEGATALSATGFFSFLNLNFETLSFNVNSMPTVQSHKIKAKKFIFYKLIFSSANNNTTATITNANIRVRYTGLVR